MNYQNHYSDSEFLAFIQATQDFSSLTIADALAILNNTGDQFTRHLLTAELTVALDQSLGTATYTNLGMVNDLLHQAYLTHDASYLDFVLYIGGDGENADPCLVCE
jgi:hypothetical protein